MVGESGTIFRRDGSVWTPMDAGTSADIRAVWGSAPGDVYAAGYSSWSGGTILHYDGNEQRTWRPVASSPAWLTGITGNSGADVFAVGKSLDGSQWVHYDGSSWSASAELQLGLLAVAAHSPQAVFAVGDSGVIANVGGVPTPDGGACERPAMAYCASEVYGSNGGRKPTFDNYACGTRDVTGAEMFYRFDSPIDGTVTVDLTNATGADLDLIVVGADTKGGCAPEDASCLGASQTAGTGKEQATVAVERGRTYYFIVDGYADALSGYSLKVTCQKQP